MSALLYLDAYAKGSVGRLQLERPFEIVLFPRQCGRVGHFPAVLVIFAVRMDAHAVLQSETSHLQVVSRAPEARQSEGIRTEIPRVAE